MKDNITVLPGGNTPNLTKNSLRELQNSLTEVKEYQRIIAQNKI